MKKVLVGSFLSAIIMMAIGTVFWMVFAGFGIMSQTPHEDAILAELKQQLPEDGTYELPLPPKTQEDPVYLQKMKQGPVVQIFIRHGGESFSMPIRMGAGFLLYLVSALLVSALLSMARLPSYGSRFLFVLVAGIFASVSVQLLNPIWWNHPWLYHLATCAHQITNWFLSAFVLAAIVRPRT